MVDAGSQMYSGYAWASWYVTKMEGSLTCVNDAVDSRARRWRGDASMASTLAQHVVDGRVVELVLGHVAQVRRQRVPDALAELACHDADQEDRLAALGVGRAVERIRTIRGVAGEVNAFAEEICVPACEWMSPHSNEDAATYFPQNERLKPCCRIFGARFDEHLCGNQKFTAPSRLLDGVAMPVAHCSTELSGAPDTLIDFHTGPRRAAELQF